MLGISSAEIPWVERANPVTGRPYRSARVVKDGGTEAIFVAYPEGSVSPPHRHPFGHGLLVIAGRLATQEGEFGPGDLVWYGAGEVGWHGAAGPGGVVALLVSAGPFSVVWEGVTGGQPG